MNFLVDFLDINEISLQLIKNLLTLLAKSMLVSLGIAAAASATDAGIDKSVWQSRTAILIISNQEMRDIMKKAKSLEDSDLLKRGAT